MVDPNTNAAHTAAILTTAAFNSVSFFFSTVPSTNDECSCFENGYCALKIGRAVRLGVSDQHSVAQTIRRDRDRTFLREERALASAHISQH